MIIDKIYSLYVTHTDKWLKLSEVTLQYSTIGKGTDYFRKFNRWDIKKHLNGRDTIGVFPLKSCSKFLIFDIDAYYSKEDAMVIANNIRHVLEGYFPKKEIHITFSGDKGYHIELFFDKLVAIADLQELFNIILTEINIKKYKGVNVEMRPELQGKEGKGIKLPLGRNHKNEIGNNYCYFADDNLQSIEYEIDYVLNIKKSDVGIVNEIIREYKDRKLESYKNGYMNNTNKVNNDILKDSSTKINYNNNKEVGTDYSNIGIKNYLENGLNEKGTRHNISFLIAMYLKKQGYNINENENILLEWSMKQVQRGMSKGNKSEIIQDIKNILKGVYIANKNYHLSKFRKDVYITKEDLNKIEALNLLGKGLGIKVISHQKILYAMIIHARRYSDIKGEFYMTYDQIQASTDIKSRNSICKILSDLDAWGYIEIVARAVKDKGSKKINLINIVLNLRIMKMIVFIKSAIIKNYVRIVFTT